MGAEEGRDSARLTSRPAAYGLAGLLLAVAGSWLAGWRWDAGPGVWVGALLAWGLQTATFWPLWRKIRRGERALRVWVAGIAARLAGLGSIAVAGRVADLAVAPAAIGYGLTLIALLLTEGFWLVRALREAEGEDLRKSPTPRDPPDS